MNPAEFLCTKCGSMIPFTGNCPSQECNEVSTQFKDRTEEKRKSRGNINGKSRRFESDLSASNSEELQEDSLKPTDRKDKFFHFSLKERNPFISGRKPSLSPAKDQYPIEDYKDVPEGNFTLGESFENDPRFLPIISIDSLYSDESTIMFPQLINPLDGTPFDCLIKDSSSVSNVGTDKIVESADSNHADFSKALRQLRIETTSKDCDDSDLSSLSESFTNDLKFLPDLSIDSLYPDESTIVISQCMNPLDGLPFDPLVKDSSSVSSVRTDKIVETADSNQTDFSKAMRELRIDATSKDCDDSASCPTNNEVPSKSEDNSPSFTSCSPDCASQSDCRGDTSSRLEH